MTKYYGDRLLSTDLTTGQGVVQLFKANADIFMIAIRTQFICFNVSTLALTGLKASVYTTIGQGTTFSLGRKIADSTNSWNISQIITQAHGVKEIYFEFASPLGLAISGSTTYAIALTATSYNGDATKHIAWKKAIYDQGYTQKPSKLMALGYAPSNLAIIGAPQ